MKIYKIIIVVLIIGAIGLMVLKQQPTQEEKYSSQIDQPTMMNNAILSLNYSQCDSISKKFLQKACKNNIAINKGIKTGEINECDNVDGNLISKEICEEQVVLTRANEKLNESECLRSTFESIRLQCTNEIIITKAARDNDYSSCTSLKEKDLNICIKSIIAKQVILNLNKDCESFIDSKYLTQCKEIKNITQ